MHVASKDYAFLDMFIFPVGWSFDCMSSLVIRAARVEDISPIVAVRLGALTEDEIRGFSAPEFAIYSSIEELRKAWAKENVLKDGFEVFVAEDKRKIVGFIAFKVEGDSGFIDNIVVAKNEQGKGVGRALVVYAENIAKSKGCSSMKTDTTENAEGIPWKSYGFWIQMRYKDTGERLSTNHDFKEICFIKTLE